MIRLEDFERRWAATGQADVSRCQDMTAQLHEEAYLLDQRRFSEWLALLSDDVRYVIPVVTNRLARQGAFEIGADSDVAHYDEDKASFAIRIKRLGTNMAWAEDPPSRICRFVSNVVVRRDDSGALLVRSYVDAYRSRVDDESGRFTAIRYDVWQEAKDGGYLLSSRLAIPTDVVLAIGNLSFWV